MEVEGSPECSKFGRVFLALDFKYLSFRVIIDWLFTEIGDTYYGPCGWEIVILKINNAITHDASYIFTEFIVSSIEVVLTNPDVSIGAGEDIILLCVDLEGIASGRTTFLVVLDVVVFPTAKDDASSE